MVNILWTHLSKMFMGELSECGGKSMLSKITLKHIQLTPYSVMTVRYGSQVLSKTVAVAMQRFGGEDATETAKFCEMMDSFFGR